MPKPSNNPKTNLSEKSALHQLSDERLEALNRKLNNIQVGAPCSPVWYKGKKEPLHFYRTAETNYPDIRWFQIVSYCKEFPYYLKESFFHVEGIPGGFQDLKGDER